MVRVIHQRSMSTESPRTEVGEIDTRAPFQSVRAAVSLFGAVATLKGKATLPSFKKQSSNLSSASSSAADQSSNANFLSNKESQLMLAEKELQRYKQRLNSAETTKSLALTDLEKVRRTLQELKDKIQTVDESKQSIVRSIEAVRQHAIECGTDITPDGASYDELHRAKEQYAVVSAELDSAKQYLTKIRQDFDAALEAKLAAFQQASEAQCTAKAHKQRASELQKEITSMQESIEQVKLEIRRTHKMRAKIMEEKEALLQSCKPAKEEAEHKLQVLRQGFDPEEAKSLEIQYAEATAEIQEVKDAMRKAHEEEMNSVRGITAELNRTTKKLQKVAAEESALRTSVASLRLELENAQKECAEAEEREINLHSLEEDLKEQLERSKAELEQLSNSRSDELITQLHQLTSEAEAQKRITEEIRKNIDKVNQETETAISKMDKAEKQLKVALVELEVAKAGEKHAVDELNNVTAVCAADFGPGGAKIKMSKRDYESLRRKNEEADNLAEMKVAAAMFQVGAISAKKSEADTKIDEALKEMEEIQYAIDFAMTQAEASEAAQRTIERELQRWREQEQGEIS